MTRLGKDSQAQVWTWHIPATQENLERSGVKPDMVAMAVSPALRRWRLEDQESKVSLGCIASLRLSWATGDHNKTNK